MRTAFLYTMSKNAPCISLILLLIASMTLVGVSCVSASPDLTTISLNPMDINVSAPGQNFTVTVNIWNVTWGLGAYEFKMSFNNSLLNATGCALGVAATNISGNPKPWIGGKWTPINNTLGRIWVGIIITYGSEFYGNGSLAIINFTATEVGNGTLHFYDTEITDKDGTIMPYTALDGSVTVLPKPPLPLISLNPMEYTAQVGDNFTVDVNITDVIDLGGWQFKLDYETTLLDAVEVICEGRITENNTGWLPTDPVTHEWIPINDTLGRVWVGALFPSGKEFAGSGPLVTINFTATEVGNYTLHLYDTMLNDSYGKPIEHETFDGVVTVISKPAISVNPMEINVLVGDNFTIDVNVTDVTNLQDYEFKLWFNNTILNATAVIPGSINPPRTVFIPDPLQNVSDGFVWTGASLPVGQAFTGSGILMTINFTTLADGNCTLHLNETVLTDPMGVEIDHVTLDGFVTVLSKIGNFHTHHINDATDPFPNDYAPMVIPVNGNSVTIAPFITCTNFEDGVWKPNHHPCKLAQTFVIDGDWSDKDANYTYAFEDWTDYDWNDIVVSLYAVTSNLIINAENFLESREAAWKNPFGVEITPMGITVKVNWNSTDYPGAHIVTVNPGDTVDIELFAESIPGKTAFITIIPLIPPTASFIYSPLHPQVCENVTFNASASTSNVGYIVSYEWDFGDASPHEFGMVVTHHYTASGTYNVTLNVTNNLGVWDTESKMITVIPQTYTLIITSTAGGTTNPAPGSYSYNEGTIVSVTAIPDAGYTLDYWELDGVNAGSDTSTSVTMNKGHTLHAVFKEVPAPPPPVGGHAAPITIDLSTSNLLVPQIALASALLAAMVAIIILIRRGNKVSKREH